MKQIALQWPFLKAKVIIKGEKFNSMGNIFKPNVLLNSNLTTCFCNIYSLLHSICKIFMMLYSIEECNGFDKLPESPSGIKEPLSQPLGVPPTESPPHLSVPFGDCHSFREPPFPPKAMLLLPQPHPGAGWFQLRKALSYQPRPSLRPSLKSIPSSSFPAGLSEASPGSTPSSTVTFAHSLPPFLRHLIPRDSLIKPWKGDVISVLFGPHRQAAENSVLLKNRPEGIFRCFTIGET